MRQICEIRKLTGGRYLVVLEDDFQFPLYGKELDHYDIREAGVLREAAETEILQELLPKRAKLCAMHFLQNSDRTEEQVRRKLRTLFYPEDIITLAVSYVKQYHYIDDVRYAANYIEYRSDSKSMRQLEQELYQKGISKEDIEAAKEQIDCPDEGIQIRNWLEKKGYSSEQADRKETERIYRFLARRGYSISAIQKEIRNFD
ncbi:regulatory protein RecX [bacterium 1XD42-54]|nr:regulatory protein RecX [bacterium 1XD42-54]